MANVKNNAAAQETKRKLIEAAGEVFADRGLERATIKEITDKAGASLAAVNYHFSDKHELYCEVIRHAHEASSVAARSLDQPDPLTPPEKRLRRFVELFLNNMLDPNRPAWHGVLLARECQQPTAAMERLIESRIRSFVRDLGHLVTELAGRPVPHEQLVLMMNSVLSQCFFYVDHQPMVARLFPEVSFSSSRVEWLADHITEFSLAAIAGLTRRKIRRPATRRPVRV